ncbi:MAG TPA: cell division protein CrgA [Actinomycetota bacterium]|jgi:hypothetical protein
MPRSKSKRRRYTPPPKKKPKPSPKWFGALILIFMLGGVAIIVMNYLSLIPFTTMDPSNYLLFAGLGAIGLGFVLATQWR